MDDRDAGGRPHGPGRGALRAVTAAGGEAAEARHRQRQGKAAQGGGQEVPGSAPGRQGEHTEGKEEHAETHCRVRQGPRPFTHRRHVEHRPARVRQHGAGPKRQGEAPRGLARARPELDQGHPERRLEREELEHDALGSSKLRAGRGGSNRWVTDPIGVYALYAGPLSALADAR